MIKSKVQTIVKKDDSRRIKDAIKKCGGAYVTIGIHEDAGKYDNSDVSVVQVALWNEFGTSRSPQRSFFRTAIDENEGKINAWREEAISNIIEKGWTAHKALEMIGFRIQVLIQNKIKSGVPPPNAPSTILAKQKAGTSPKSGLKKGHENSGTLINTGLMLRSVTYKVYAK